MHEYAIGSLMKTLSVKKNSGEFGIRDLTFYKTVLEF